MGLPKVADLAMGKSFRDAVELPTFAAASVDLLARMVRPLFAKLGARAAAGDPASRAEEFAARGFHDASLNRVIEAAGISKAFDGSTSRSSGRTVSE